MDNLAVFIISFRESERLGACLDTLEAQTNTDLIDAVYVVDHPSFDGTKELVEQYNGKLDVRYLECPYRGRAQGLNFAIRNIDCTYFVRVDARSIVPTNYIEIMYNTILTNDVDVVGGVQRAITSHNLSDQQNGIALSMNSWLGAGYSRHRIGGTSGDTDVVYLGIYKSEKVIELGLFDEQSKIISEEVDYFYRLKQVDGSVYLRADVIIYYYSRNHLVDQMRLYFRYGGAKSQFIKKYLKITSIRQLIPTMTYVFFVSTLIFSFVNVFFLILFLCSYTFYALFICYNVCISNQGFNYKIKFYCIMSIILMHFGYFLGYFFNLFIPQHKLWKS